MIGNPGCMNKHWLNQCYPIWTKENREDNWEPNSDICRAVRENMLVLFCSRGLLWWQLRGFCVIRNCMEEQLNAGARLFAFKSHFLHCLDVQYLACFFSFSVYPILLKKKMCKELLWILNKSIQVKHSEHCLSMWNVREVSINISFYSRFLISQ